MILKNELRIGNWIYPNEENATPYPVVELYENDIVCYRSQGIHRYDEDVTLTYREAVRIKITKDWLLKNGFKRYDYKSKEEPLLFSFNNYINCYADNQDNYSTIYVSCSNDELDEQRLCRNIEHVHTFQNLYFVLAGEELSDMIAREQI